MIMKYVFKSVIKLYLLCLSQLLQVDERLENDEIVVYFVNLNFTITFLN